MRASNTVSTEGPAVQQKSSQCRPFKSFLSDSIDTCYLSNAFSGQATVASVCDFDQAGHVLVLNMRLKMSVVT